MQTSGWIWLITKNNYIMKNKGKQKRTNQEKKTVFIRCVLFLWSSNLDSFKTFPMFLSSKKDWTPLAMSNLWLEVMWGSPIHQRFCVGVADLQDHAVSYQLGRLLAIASEISECTPKIHAMKNTRNGSRYHWTRATSLGSGYIIMADFVSVFAHMEP